MKFFIQAINIIRLYLKFKLIINKLILSCAALAAVATTAVSTTYAWYTSNQEVTADGIEASTASNSDALLLISTTGAANSWSSSVNLAINATLSPAYKDASGNMKVWAADSNTATGNAPTGSYISFSLYFKSGNGNALKVSYKEFDLVNTTVGAALPSKSVLTNDGLPTGATSSGTYTVDFIKALTMENKFGLTTEGDAGTSEQAFGTNVGDTDEAYFKFDNYATRTDTVASNSVNAHTYYNSVKQLNYKRADSFDSSATYYTKSGDVYTVASISAFAADTTYYTLANGTYTAVASTATFDENETYYTYTPATYTQAATQPTSTTFENDIYYVVAAIEERYDGSVEYRTSGETTRTSVTSKGANASAFNTNDFIIGTADKILRVDYVIYLDGWDYQCFDACQGQTLSLAMTFNSNAASA